MLPNALPFLFLLLCSVDAFLLPAAFQSQTHAPFQSPISTCVSVLTCSRNHVRLSSKCRGNALSAKNISTISSTKTSGEESFIKKSLLENALFSGMPPDSLQRLAEAFQRRTSPKGEIIIAQGDSCDGGCVYLVAEGSCRVLVDNVTVPEPYGIIEPPAVFGELGILYDERRAATIVANSDPVMYYQVAGDVFKTELNAYRPSPMRIGVDKMKEIDAAINQIEGTQALYGGNVIPRYQPQRLWLWRQFARAGTILKISLETTLLSMLGCVVFVMFAKAMTDQPLFGMDFVPPDHDQPFVQNLSQIHEIWDIQKALTTFVLTFFVNQSFNFWKSVYQLSRDVQGKLNGFHMMLATNVHRNKDGSLTAEAERFLDDVGQYSRLFHVLMWVGKAKRFSLLCTTEGLQRMESRGLMSGDQLDILLNLDVPDDQLFSARNG